MTIDYAAYIESPAWQAKVAAAKRLVNYRCQVCNRPEDEAILDGHHRTYERLGSELPTDVTVLCRDCHELYERHQQLARHAPGGPSRAPRITEPGPILHDIASALEQPPARRCPVGAVPTGFARLDTVLGGLRSGNLLVVAGRPGVGKSGLVTDIALTAARRFRKRVLFFSQQLPAAQLLEQLLMHETGVPTPALATGNVPASEQALVLEGVRGLNNMPLMIVDTPGLTPAQMGAVCREVQAGEGLDLVVVDGFDSLWPDRQLRSPVHETLETARSLKQLAGELAVPMLVTCVADGGGNRPSDGHRSESMPDSAKLGGLERIADVVLCLYRKTWDSPDTDRADLVDIVVARHRGGVRENCPVFGCEKTGVFRDLELVRGDE